MSWKDPCLSFIKKYGKTAKNVASGVLNVVAPGSGTLVALVELACEKAVDTAQDHWEASLLKATQNNTAELQRLGQLFEMLGGDLASLCDKAALFADQPDDLPGMLGRAIAINPALSRGLHTIETIKAQCDAFQADLRLVARHQEEAIPIYARMHRVCDYFDELWDIGIQPRDFARQLQQRQGAAECIAQGDTTDAASLLLELRTTAPQAASICVLEAALATREHDYPSAQRALTSAVKLRPDDSGLVELSQRVTALATKAQTRERQPGQPPCLQPGDVLDGWRLEARLGTGGWGQVFKATRDGQRRAIKVMHPEYATNAAFTARFRQEIGSLLTLPEHPNLVKIDKGGHGFGYCDDRRTWYLVMEYIDGPTLESYLAAKGPLCEGEVRDLFSDTIAGLAEAHKIGIIHRDIKPGNLIYRQQDGRLVIVDFGLSVVVTVQGQTTLGGMSTLFAAPEQTRGKSATQASDVFSLCAVIHYALNYDKPDRRTPEEFSPAFIPEALRAAVTRGMITSAKERLQNASELLAALTPPPPPPPISRSFQLRTSSNDGTITLPSEFGFGTCRFSVLAGKSSSFRVEPLDGLAAATEFALRQLMGLNNPSGDERKTKRAVLASDASEAEKVLSEIYSFAIRECGLADGPRFGGGKKAGGKEKPPRLDSWSFCFSYECAWVGGQTGLQSLRGRR